MSQQDKKKKLNGLNHVAGLTIIGHKKLARMILREFYVNLFFDEDEKEIIVYVEKDLPKEYLDIYLDEEYGMGLYIKRENVQVLSAQPHSN